MSPFPKGGWGPRTTGSEVEGHTCPSLTRTLAACSWMYEPDAGEQGLARGKVWETISYHWCECMNLGGHAHFREPEEKNLRHPLQKTICLALFGVGSLNILGHLGTLYTLSNIMQYFNYSE